MKIIVLAAAERGRRCLAALYESITDEDDVIVFTFKETQWEPPFVSDIDEIAKLNNSKFFVTSKVHSDEYSEYWQSGCDVIFVIGWRYLIPSSVYNSAKLGCFVFHDSYLPNYRGFGPTVWAIRNGEEYTGTTLFKISEEMDEGAVLYQSKIKIKDDEYISDVMEKITSENEVIIKKAYRDAKINKITFSEQDHSRATYTCKNIPDDFKIDWSSTALAIRNLIRAYSKPYSGAFTYLDGKKLKIWSADIEVVSNYIGYIPGRVKSINQDGTVTVFCGKNSALKLKYVSLEQSKAVLAKNVIKSISSTLT